MKIAIIGPGGSSIIPPIGWGAVEILIYDMSECLKKQGHEVTIINSASINDMINEANSQHFDMVHIQYDDRIDMIPHLKCRNIAITNHFAYLEQPQLWAVPGSSHGGWCHIFNKIVASSANILCLSPGIASVYRTAGVEPHRLYVIKNGVRTGLFKFKKSPAFPTRSLYLAKIDYRKRQHMFQDVDNLFFAGNLAEPKFQKNHPRYLGEWDKSTLYNNLTDYGNLALLSDGEAHPLVCMEAMSAGLGLVISSFASANLDLTLPFIDVITEDKMTDKEYISAVLENNRVVSINYREEIREYAKSLSWDQVVEDLYIPTYESIIAKSQGAFLI